MKNTILKNVNVFDGKPESAILNNVDILIENGLIKKIGKDIEDKSAKVVDLSGKYVIPGLINLHSHIPGSGRITKKQVAKRTGLVSFVVNTHLGRAAGLKICEAHAKQNLYSGVTTVRLVGGIDNFDAILRDKINSGKAIGPRLIVANYAVGPVHSHMEGTVSVSAKTNEEAVAYVEKQIAKGADFINFVVFNVSFEIFGDFESNTVFKTIFVREIVSGFALRFPMGRIRTPNLIRDFIVLCSVVLKFSLQSATFAVDGIPVFNYRVELA